MILRALITADLPTLYCVFLFWMGYDGPFESLDSAIENEKAIMNRICSQRFNIELH